MLRIKLDSFGTNFTLSKLRIDQQISIRNDEYIQRRIFTRMRKNVDNLSTTCCFYNMLCDTENITSWTQERVNLELKVWKVFAEELLKINFILNRYKDEISTQLITNTGEDEATSYDLAEWLEQIDELLSIAQPLKRFVVLCNERIYENMDYQELNKMMIRQDKLYNHFKKMHTYLCKETFFYMNNLKCILEGE